MQDVRRTAVASRRRKSLLLHTRPTAKKLALVKSLGVDTAIDYSEKTWPDQAREATGGKGVDAALEAASGEVANESFKLVAPFGRVVFFDQEHSRHDFFRENPATDL